MTGENRERSLARLFGVDAERMAVVALILKGYWPLARHYRGTGGEIDLIVRRGRTIVAVEVKARRSRESAATAIGAVQIARIERSFRAFRADRRLDDSHDFRMDAVFVSPWRWPEHVENIAELT
jgi:putative endonuclease